MALMANSNEIPVFYSWQSDCPEETNLNAIREGLIFAAKKFKATHPGIKIVRDEATRDTSGSPNIVAKLLEKIELADVFIADVTTIAPPGAKRPCPNPNVSHELGYAVAHVGWDRIILLFNEAFGSFPADLPFDFAQHRANPYTLTTADHQSGSVQLGEILKVAISAVLEKEPKRPAELRGVPRQKLEHDQEDTLCCCVFSRPKTRMNRANRVAEFAQKIIGIVEGTIGENIDFCRFQNPDTIQTTI